MEQWCARATTALAEPQDARASPRTVNASKMLERESLSKDLALAETAALLVSKKFAAIYKIGEDA
jgi:transposase